MAIAMMVGMRLVTARSMTVPMVAWMRYRGHTWNRSLETGRRNRPGDKAERLTNLAAIGENHSAIHAP